jgi:hypothetical protein
MTWRDKLEIGLKENASYRKDNLPATEVTGAQVPQGPGRSAEVPHARETRTATPAASSAPAVGDASRPPGRRVRRRA